MECDSAASERCFVNFNCLCEQSRFCGSCARLSASDNGV